MSEARRIIQEFEDFTATQIRNLAINLTAQLSESTPVDVGWARNNWVPQIGKPYRKTGADTPKGNRTQRKAKARGQGRRAQTAQTKVALYKWGDGTIYVSNNVPYINRLNYGHSQQQPQNNWIERDIDKVIGEST